MLAGIWFYARLPWTTLAYPRKAIEAYNDYLGEFTCIVYCGFVIRMWYVYYRYIMGMLWVYHGYIRGIVWVYYGYRGYIGVI